MVGYDLILCPKCGIYSNIKCARCGGTILATAAKSARVCSIHHSVNKYKCLICGGGCAPSGKKGLLCPVCAVFYKDHCIVCKHPA